MRVTIGYSAVSFAAGPNDVFRAVGIMSGWIADILIIRCSGRQEPGVTFHKTIRCEQQGITHQHGQSVSSTFEMEYAEVSRKLCKSELRS